MANSVLANRRLLLLVDQRLFAEKLLADPGLDFGGSFGESEVIGSQLLELVLDALGKVRELPFGAGQGVGHFERHIADPDALGTW